MILKRLVSIHAALLRSLYHPRLPLQSRRRLAFTKLSSARRCMSGKRAGNTAPCPVRVVRANSMQQVDPHLPALLAFLQTQKGPTASMMLRNLEILKHRESSIGVVYVNNLTDVKFALVEYIASGNRRNFIFVGDSEAFSNDDFHSVWNNSPYKSGLFLYIPLLLSKKLTEWAVSTAPSVKGTLKLFTLPGNTMSQCLLPDGYELSSLKPSDALSIAKEWSYLRNLSLQDKAAMFEKYITYNESVCCLQTKPCTKADDSGSDDRGQRLVCWMMQYDTGLIGHLFTLEEHRGKGLAKAVMTEMCRKVSSTGEPVLVPVAHENHPSISLCKKVGLVEIEEEFFVLRLEKKHTLICSEE